MFNHSFLALRIRITCLIKVRYLLSGWVIVLTITIIYHAISHIAIPHLIWIGHFTHCIPQGVFTELIKADTFIDYRTSSICYGFINLWGFSPAATWPTIPPRPFSWAFCHQWDKEAGQWLLHRKSSYNHQAQVQHASPKPLGSWYRTSQHSLGYYSLSQLLGSLFCLLSGFFDRFLGFICCHFFRCFGSFSCRFPTFFSFMATCSTASLEAARVSLDFGMALNFDLDCMETLAPFTISSVCLAASVACLPPLKDLFLFQGLLHPFLSKIPYQIDFKFLIRIVQLDDGSHLMALSLGCFHDSAIGRRTEPSLVVRIVLNLRRCPIPGV